MTVYLHLSVYVCIKVQISYKNVKFTEISNKNKLSVQVDQTTVVNNKIT